MTVSALANVPGTHCDQTVWLAECLCQTVDANFHETQLVRRIEIMAKLTADVEARKNG